MILPASIEIFAPTMRIVTVLGFIWLLPLVVTSASF